MIIRRSTAALLAATGLSLAASGAASAGPGVTNYEIEAPYEQVRQDLADAIINRGYVIDYNARIGDMLARTAAAVGASKDIYNSAETLQFCSAVLSRKAMEADPLNIAFCPYAIFVYETADDEGTVTVGYRSLENGSSEASKAALDDVNEMLDEIAREATGQ